MRGVFGYFFLGERGRVGLAAWFFVLRFLRFDQAPFELTDRTNFLGSVFHISYFIESKQRVYQRLREGSIVSKPIDCRLREEINKDKERASEKG